MTDREAPPGGRRPNGEGGENGDSRSRGDAVEADSPVATEELRRIRRLIRQLESDIPETYRAAVLRFLLPRVWGGGEVAGAGIATEPGAPAAPEGESAEPAARLRARRIDIAPFSELLAQPGKNLLKALVALEVARAQLDVEWMTPSEIERFLTERARVESVYRTNLSNALRSAREGVDRRRRGRGYEYRITDRGRALLRRELEIIGP